MKDTEIQEIIKSIALSTHKHMAKQFDRELRHKKLNCEELITLIGNSVSLVALYMACLTAEILTDKFPTHIHGKIEMITFIKGLLESHLKEEAPVMH